MWEFFRPLRRKIGVCTLVLACMATAVWVRTWYGFDHLRIAWGQKGFGQLRTYRNGIISGWYDWDQIEPWAIKWQYLLDADNHFSPKDYPTTEWRSWAGIISGITRSNQNSARSKFHTSLFIPHGFIVLPLTLISAFLLLSKPRQSNQQKIAQPVQDDRGGAAS